MKVGVIMSKLPFDFKFYIRCVIRIVTLEKAIYDVVTNCGVSRFIPMDGDVLPRMAVDFMSKNAEHMVVYATTPDTQVSAFFDGDYV